MTQNWGAGETSKEVHPAASHSAARRLRLGERFTGKTLVIPTGNFKVRSNDTDYPFRAGSDFFYLTGSDEPDCALVISPGTEGPRSTLYVPRRRDTTSHEFYTDSRYGEFWVGERRGVEEAAIYYAIDTAPLDNLEKDLVDLGVTDVVTLRGYDEAIDAMSEPSADDEELAIALGEARLVKDEFEIEQLQLAVDFTVKGFEDVVRALPAGRGSRGARHRRGLQPARPRRRQRRRLRHHRGQRTSRLTCTGRATTVTFDRASCCCSTRA